MYEYRLKYCMTIDLDLLFQGQIQFLFITLKLIVLETVLVQGQTNDLFKVCVILVSGTGESMIHSFILVIFNFVIEYIVSRSRFICKFN